MDSKTTLNPDFTASIRYRDVVLPPVPDGFVRSITQAPVFTEDGATLIGWRVIITDTERRPA